MLKSTQTTTKIVPRGTEKRYTMSKKEMEKIRTLLFANIKYLIVSKEPKRIVTHANSIKAMFEAHDFYQIHYPNRNNVNKWEKDYYCVPIKAMTTLTYSDFQIYVKDRVVSYGYYNGVKSTELNQIINYISNYYKDKFDMRLI